MPSCIPAQESGVDFLTFHKATLADLPIKCKLKPLLDTPMDEKENPSIHGQIPLPHLSKVQGLPGRRCASAESR